MLMPGAYPFVATDAGRKQSRRSRQSNDCSVRAVALVLNLEYDVAYDKLAAAGRKCGKGFDVMKWLNTQPWATKISFPAVKGERRMNPVRFCAEHPKGRYICRVAKHVFAVIDGVVHDNFRSSDDRCIYVCWQIDIGAVRHD